jgi:hypothetical protein
VCLLLSVGNECGHHLTFALGSMVLAVAACGWSAKTEKCNALWAFAMITVGAASIVWLSNSFWINQLEGMLGGCKKCFKCMCVFIFAVVFFKY